MFCYIWCMLLLYLWPLPLEEQGSGVSSSWFSPDQWYKQKKHLYDFELCTVVVHDDYGQSVVLPHHGSAPRSSDQSDASLWITNFQKQQTLPLTNQTPRCTVGLQESETCHCFHVNQESLKALYFSLLLSDSPPTNETSRFSPGPIQKLAQNSCLNRSLDQSAAEAEAQSWTLRRSHPRFLSPDYLCASCFLLCLLPPSVPPPMCPCLLSSLVFWSGRMWSRWRIKWWSDGGGSLCLRLCRSAAPLSPSADITQRPAPYAYCIYEEKKSHDST